MLQAPQPSPKRARVETAPAADDEDAPENNIRTEADDLFIDDEGVEPADYQDGDGDPGHMSEAEEEQDDDEITKIFTQKKRKREGK